jgi:copper chaperone
MEERRIAIEGMSCNHCVMSVRKALAQIPGIEVKDVQIGSAFVAASDTSAFEGIRAAVEKVGFTVAS